MNRISFGYCKSDMESNSISLCANLAAQIDRIEELRKLPFDNTMYDEWRYATGRILDGIFGYVESEHHPFVQAFLSYQIPEHFTASRAEMQEFYANILNYQSALLAMYLEDIRKPG